ncbi:MAG: TIGR00296 family protein [Thermoplasmata archaeon]|nr:TIGR00296 family protein [Thermoplasmata archaeon]
MGFSYTDEEGEFAVKTARSAVKNYLFKGNTGNYRFPEKFEKKSGVFTTINSYPDNELRGCIGFPEPIMPLKDALIKSAIYAATEDPRFSPLNKEELDKVIFEVSLLTVPEEIKAKIPENVEIGKDGLIVEYGFYSGLLLPQVATEYNMDQETFLDQTCIKAGLSPGCWKNSNVKVFKFQAEIFKEERPKGNIKRVVLK